MEVISPKEVDTVIVAGMGGMLIRDILSQEIETARTIHRFILQPMNAQPELREWLLKNAFKIIHEELAMEGQRIYEIIVAENGHQEIGERINLEISPKLIQRKDPLLRIFIQKKIQKQREIIAHLSGQNTEKAIRRRKECNEKLQQLEGVLKCLKE
ncbi:MAG TPA: SAM-dependent methyltransferase [Clostridiales bacterium]|nr:SAM-dependent methyltransferase [Clostridiales bacterium]